MPGTDKATYQHGLNELQAFLTKVEQDDKYIFFKEHIFFILDPEVCAAKFSSSSNQAQRPCPKVVDETAHGSGKEGHSINGNGMVQKTNPSALPDSFIRTLSPSSRSATLPPLSHPSTSPDFMSGSTFAWSRITFDWFCEHAYPQRKDTARGYSSWPLVVDGDDLVNDNERVISAICSLAKLDMKGITKEWEVISEEIKEKQPESVQRFWSTLQASTGIIKSGLKGEDITIGKEAEKWNEEFGPEVAHRLKEAVEVTMDDYLYLSQFRI